MNNHCSGVRIACSLLGGVVTALKFDIVNHARYNRFIKYTMISSAVLKTVKSSVKEKMSNYLDIKTLATLVQNKRLTRGLRETSKEIGTVSPSTISRVENGKIPDMDTFLTLCDWLEVPPAELIKNTAHQEVTNTPEAISILLQSDATLDPTIASALALIIKAAYKELSQVGQVNNPTGG
jgi:transcriptional regulator with XRE-family HTH domain